MIIKKIGILTSGGDAPGMNPAIRALTRSAIANNIKVVGIKNGYKGLLNEEFIELDLRSVSNIIREGGTMLYSSRCPEFKEIEVQKNAISVLRKQNIDLLMCLGGDGTFRGAKSLSELGMPVIGIPCTIDNDVAASDYTIGFDTAVNTVIEMTDKVRDTSRSHSRCAVIEVMGRDAGYIAIESAISCGAIATLIPERPYDIDVDVINPILKAEKIGKKNFLIIVAEGCGSATEISNIIKEKTHIETNPVVIGYVQRGGSPSNMDRVTAAKMGYLAIELCKKSIINQIIVRQNGQILPIDIDKALKMKKTIDSYSIDVAKIISI